MAALMLLVVIAKSWTAGVHMSRWGQGYNVQLLSHLQHVLQLQKPNLRIAQHR
jgi:hypothetical protein